METLILTDTEDSLLVKAGRQNFDFEGKYCFEVQSEESGSYYQTNNGRIGTSIYLGSSFSSRGGDISYTTEYNADTTGVPWYYKNRKSVTALGPVQGRLKSWITSNTRNHIAIVTTFRDTAFCYIDGQQIAAYPSSNALGSGVDFDNWCAFSEGGNTIYYTKKDSAYHLFANGKCIATSAQTFRELHINNSGYYTYAEGQQPKTKTRGYDYQFFVHTPDSVFGPVRTVWRNGLEEDNSYCYSGDDNGPEYVLVNNYLQKNIYSVGNIMLPNKREFFFTFKREDTTFANASGRIYPLPKGEILNPAINANGAFALYLLKDYYLYKCINGVLAKRPITKYGVRPMPFYISPQGVSLHAFITDDSVFLYKDDTLLLKPISRTKAFRIEEPNDIISDPTRISGEGSAAAWFYLQYDTTAYWVYKGTLSEPMLLTGENEFAKNRPLDVIAAGGQLENGFFSVQKTGAKDYRLNLSNRIYKTFKGIDELFPDSFFFKEKEVVFYGRKGLSFYRFKLLL